MSDKNFKDFPAYLMVTKRMPAGHEVLYNYGASYGLCLVLICFRILPFLIPLAF